MRNWLRNSLYVCILVSLLIHLGLWIGLRWAPQTSFLQPKQEKVEIEVLDQRPKPAEQPKQIVEQSKKAINDETPKNAKYLSMNNQSVIHETRAQNTGKFRNSPGTGANHFKESKAQKLAQQIPHNKIKMHGRKLDKNGELPTLTDLSPNLNPMQAPADDTQSGNGQAPSQANDFLKDTPPSLETLLNTREFIYYTYYQRIRSQIRQYWEPCIRRKVEKIFASGRTLASEHDHITRVIIVLDRNGNLIKVQVVGRSGVRDLDDAAVEAFRAAAPFPNPPKGIVGPDGTIKINWDFILQADNLDPLVLQDLYASR